MLAELVVGVGGAGLAEERERLAQAGELGGALLAGEQMGLGGRVCAERSRRGGEQFVELVFRQVRVRRVRRLRDEVQLRSHGFSFLRRGRCGVRG